jgi:hypothetical protein
MVLDRLCFVRGCPCSCTGLASCPADLQLVLSGELQAGFRRLAPKFQHSLSAVTLDIYRGNPALYPVPISLSFVYSHL